MDVKWAQIRPGLSWHALNPDRFGVTYCGRIEFRARFLDKLPGGEKSCESCLRIIARKADA